MSAPARAAALATMRQEIEHQVADLAGALRAARGDLERLAAEMAEARRTISAGIGDSHLAGRLAAEMLGSSDAFAACSAEELARCDAGPGTLALCQSISGTTSITLAAARLLRHRGARIAAVTSEPSTPLAELSDLTVVLPIPRYPPDAKVPGTCTVSIPVAAIVAAAGVARGADVDSAFTAVVNDLREALAEGARLLDSQSSAMHAPRAAQIVARPGSAVAAYLQAKLAETAGITASIGSAEEWLHVAKHAVDAGVLVIALASGCEPLLLDAIAGECAARGGSFATTMPRPAIDAPTDGLHLSLAAGFPAPARRELLRDLAFSQHVALHLLGEEGEWAPFQLHRLSKESVRGISRRHWHAEPAGIHQEES